MNHRDSYVAGIVDGEASIGVYVQEHSIGIGYKVQPQIVIVQWGSEELECLLCKFCEEHGIKYSKQKRNERLDFKIQDRQSVKTMWAVLSDALLVKKEEMRILAEEVIPMLDDGRHLVEDGFLEVMKAKEEMDNQKAERSSSDRTYTYQYFKEELKGA